MTSPASTNARHWRTLPKEIRQKIISHLLSSCCSIDMVAEEITSRRTYTKDLKDTLNAVVRVGFTFAIEDVLMPLLTYHEATVGMLLQSNNERERFGGLINRPIDGTIASTQKGDDGSDKEDDDETISALAFTVYMVKGSIATLENELTCLREELAADALKLLMKLKRGRPAMRDARNTEAEAHDGDTSFQLAYFSAHHSVVKDGTS